MIVETIQQTDAQRAVIFGSRAKGNYRYHSDIDICVFGAKDSGIVGHLLTELDELPMPYQFDVAAYEFLASLTLRAHIDRVGVEILRREDD